MPKIIQHIDKIARKKERDVLYVVFDEICFPEKNYEQWEIRNTFVTWLTRHNINYCECVSVANENFIESYAGQLYLDIPYDESNSDYISVKNYLEYPDGSPRFIGITWYLIPLAYALKNKHHDEPDFWEKWAEKF